MNLSEGKMNLRMLLTFENLDFLKLKGHNITKTYKAKNKAALALQIFSRLLDIALEDLVYNGHIFKFNSTKEMYMYVHEMNLEYALKRLKKLDKSIIEEGTSLKYVLIHTKKRRFGRRMLVQVDKELFKYAQYNDEVNYSQILGSSEYSVILHKTPNDYIEELQKLYPLISTTMLKRTVNIVSNVVFSAIYHYQGLVISRFAKAKAIANLNVLNDETDKNRNEVREKQFRPYMNQLEFLYSYERS